MKYSFKELVDVEKLQGLTNELYLAAAIPSAIISIEGEILTSSEWQRICGDFHRKHPQTEKECIKSDVGIREELDNGKPFVIYKCPRGLYDASAPIVIAGEHVASVFAGQVFLDPPDETTEKEFRQQAREFGFDETDYIKAFWEVPVIPKDRFKAALSFLSNLSKIIADMGLVRLRELEAMGALQESEEKFKSLANNINVGVYRNTLGPEGRFIEANPAIVKMFGFEGREEFLKRNVSELYQNPGDRSAYNEKLLKEGAVRNEELQLRKKDGTSFIGSISAVIVKDKEGNPKYYDGVIEDITERKRTEEALRENEEKYRHLFESAMVGIYRTRIEDGKFLAANQVLAEMLGYRTVDALISEYVTSEHYKDADRRELLLAQLASVGRVDEFEIEMERADGSSIQFAISATVYPDRGYLEGVVVDITDRVEAETALRESEKRFRTLVENSPDLLYRTDITGAIEYVSPSAYRLSGYTVEEAIGMKMAEEVYAYPEERETFLKKLMEKGFVKNFQARLKRKDGSIWWASTNAHFLKDKDGNVQGVEGVTRDVSELMDAEEEKKRLRSQLQQSQKFEAIATLAGGVAHDFNNLLMGIQGRASLMRMDLDRRHPHSDHIHAIEEYIQSATDLTKQLLGFARGGKYEVKPSDVNELVLHSSALFGRTRKEIKIHTKLSRSTPVAEVDHRQIEQVLLNLYVNAWQAMPDGGELYLETKEVTLDHAYCESHHMKAGDYIKVSVTDTGIGMDDDTRRRVFDPFFTTKEKSRGTGLGLASAYGIMKNHDGIITVYSEAGHGTTFNLYLPLSRKSVYREVRLEDRIKKGTETILLIDDEEMIIDVGQAMLEKLGYRVLVANSGEEGVETVKQMGAEIDLVILDLIMPGMDGGKTFDCIRDMRPEIPVVLSSGYAINGHATEIIQRGCNGFIQKPFNISELSQKIRNVLV